MDLDLRGGFFEEKLQTTVGQLATEAVKPDAGVATLRAALALLPDMRADVAHSAAA